MRPLALGRGRPSAGGASLNEYQLEQMLNQMYRGDAAPAGDPIPTAPAASPSVEHTSAHPSQGLPTSLPGRMESFSSPASSFVMPPPELLQQQPHLESGVPYWMQGSQAVASPYWMPAGAQPDQAHSAHDQPGPAHGFDVHAVRKDFPILQQRVNGKPLVWLDNAATTQKPRMVIDRISRFYEEENSNVHRAAHEMAARATDAYEHAREKVRRFIGAAAVEEIIFTRGTTESINLVAQTYGKQHLGRGDEIILIEYEHHANIVPWQHVCQETGAVIRVAPILDNGEIDLAAYERLFSPRTRMVAIGHVSNVLGTVAPVRDMIASAHRRGAVVLVDGAQSAPHFPVNVQEMDADFFVLSGHKLYGPTGIGVLYGKKSLLDDMPPWQGGGNMIEHVTFEHTTYNSVPARFEAGTPILAGAVGLGAAIDYLDRIGFANAARYEDELLVYAQERLAAIPGLRMIGTAPHKAGVLSFVSDRITPTEFGQILNREGIAVRTGHHCAQPALAHYGLKESVRPSLAFYNTREEIDLLVDTVSRAMKAR
jgi:cysteine desulfurase/selenocysteine lyase